MLFKIDVVIFASDNIQGASGNFFNSSFVAQIPEDVSLGVLEAHLHVLVQNYKLNHCPFQQNSRIIIQKIELLSPHLQ